MQFLRNSDRKLIVLNGRQVKEETNVSRISVRPDTINVAKCFKLRKFKTKIKYDISNEGKYFGSNIITNISKFI